MHAPARLHRPSPAKPAAPAPRAAAPVPRPASALPADAAAAHSFARVSVHPAPVVLQAKLRVGGAGDPHEREAERTAERVMRESAPAPHRCSCGGTCPACRAQAAKRKELARAAAGGAPAPSAVPAVVHEVIGGPGRPLDASAAAFLEPRFGHDFGRVRVHADGRAAESARAVGARAYTVGRHVVFGAGEYRPETEGGRRLLAHELTHVLQQDASPTVLRRAPAPTPPAVQASPTGTAATPATPAKDPPHLELRTKEKPCACLVFVHNEERNARLTADLMQKHCDYNLAMIKPDVPGQRRVTVKGQPGTFDPNSFFDPAVIAACRKDPQGCSDFVANNRANATLEWTQKQFFMAVHDCSKGFSLPVVALHNNSIADTRSLVAKKKGMKDPFKGVPRDLDKAAPVPKGKPKPVRKLKDALEKRFGPEVRAALTEGGGSTNAFRWCTLPDIVRCHIGDPDHPDNVVWVTNEADFEKLAAEKVNVSLQGAVGPESVGDLSSMFLELGNIIGAETLEKARPLWEKLDLGDFFTGELGSEILEILRVVGAGTAAMEGLHFVNVETPAHAGDGTPRDQHMIEQYDAIVATLKPLGLHCCGNDDAETKKGEDAVKAEIKAALAPPPKEEKKKPAPK